MVLANFLGIQELIFLKNIGHDCGNTTCIYCINGLVDKAKSNVKKVTS
jgi:hypothetical protein